MNHDLNPIRQEARNLRENNDYQSAMPLYKKLWESRPADKPDNNTKWDGWGYALCLNQLREFEKAIEVCKVIRKLDPGFSYNNNCYAWAAFNLYIKDFDIEHGDINELIKYAKGILDLTEGSSDNLWRSAAVLKVMEGLEAKGRWEDLLEWAGKIDVIKLSEQTSKFTLPNGRTILLPSQKDKWFSKTTKAYEKLGKFQDCLRVTETALASHPDDIWLMRRKAICLGNLGREDEALDLMHQIIKQKQDWFIFLDIAQVYIKKDDFENALKYCLDGAERASRNPNQEYLLELYYVLAKILKHLNRLDEAGKYCLLCLALRAEHGWKIPGDLSALANELNVHHSPSIKSEDLINELSRLRESQKYKGKEELTGKITKILENGKGGFIKSDSGNSYYFSIREFKGRKEKCVAGAQVKFMTEKSFDRKKGKESEIAVNIRIVST